MKQTFFRIGSYLMLMMGVAHFVLTRNGVTIPNMTKEARVMLDTMKSFEIDLGMGVHKTMWELLLGFIVSWGLLVFFVGFLDLWVLRFERFNDTLLNRVALTNVTGLAFIIVIGFVFFSYPVILFASVVLLFFLASLLAPTTQL